MSDLLPCPFCGGENVSLSESGLWVMCDNCEGDGPTAASGLCKTPREGWNRRAPADPALLALAKLAAKLFDRAWIKSVGFVNEGGIQDDLDRDTVAFGLVRYEAPGDFQMAPGIADAIAALLAPDGAGEVADG